VTPEVQGIDTNQIKYELVMHVFDPLLVKGTIAFTSIGNKETFLDNITVVNIKCSEYDTNQIQPVITNTCSRYNENFKNVEDKWSIFNYSDINNIKGKPRWTVIKKFEFRESVLAQTELIANDTEYEDGNMFVLKDDTKECNDGIIKLKFKAIDYGIIGVVFKFNKNNDSFYIFEISSEKDAFVRLRKRIGGAFHLISVRQSFGYKLGEWYNLKLRINANKFNAFTSMVDVDKENGEVKLFEDWIVDDSLDIRSGLVGFSCYKTRIYIYDFAMLPFEDTLDHNPLVINEDLLYVDEEDVLQSNLNIYI